MGTRITVHATTLREAIVAVSHAAAQNEYRPILCAVALTGKPDGLLHVVACDNYRLARYKVRTDDSNAATFGTAVVPRDTLPLLNLFLKHYKGQLVLERTDEGAPYLIVMGYGQEQLRVRLIDGVYPDYEEIYEKLPRHPRVLTVKGSQLAEAWRAAGSGEDRPLFMTTGDPLEPVYLQAGDYDEVVMGTRGPGANEEREAIGVRIDATGAIRLDRKAVMHDGDVLSLTCTFAEQDGNGVVLASVADAYLVRAQPVVVET